MTRTITVSGMSCEGCAETVEDAIDSVDGVSSVEADHDAGTASVDGEPDLDAVVEAIEDAGYEASI